MAIQKFDKQIPSPGSAHAQDLILLQERFEPILNHYSDDPINDHIYLEDIDIGTSVTLVSHGLNRTWRDYKILKQNANATIWYDDTNTDDWSLFLPLVASSAVTISLLVW